MTRSIFRARCRVLGTVALSVAVLPSLARASQVQIGADFTRPTGLTATARQFGLNAFQGFAPSIAGTPGDPTYKANVAYMQPGFLRHHSWDMLGASTTPSGWLVNPTSAQASWDGAKIQAALTGSYAFGPTRVMNIPLWPSALSDSSGKLTTGSYAAFASYCAALVKAVNVDAHAGVTYWEVTNEQDGTYQSDMGELARIVLQAATAMRAVDPSIKVGGPAFANVWQGTRLEDFMAVAGNQLDFISYHSYATGDGSASNASIWDAADIGWVTQQVRTTVAKHASPLPELFHDEYNISYAPPDAKMNDMVGGVFDALAMIALVNAGADAAAAWNEADGWYGKLDGSWALRPAAHVFHVFNTSMTGAVVTTTTADAKSVVTLAVQTAQRQALVLVHRSDQTDTARVTLTGVRPELTTATTRTVTQAGLVMGTTTAATLASGVELAPRSVMVITFGSESGIGDAGAATDAASPGPGPGVSSDAGGPGEAATAPGGAGAPGAPATASSPSPASAGCQHGTTAASSRSALVGGAIALLAAWRRRRRSNGPPQSA